jgi:predicted transcriptional regulator
VSYRTILNTDDLLPGDERALAMLMWRGLVEENRGKGAYRLTDTGHKAARSMKVAA